MNNEPIRHHYIPQFILKNFCFDGRRLLYFDKVKRQIYVKDTKEIFMVKNLYCDKINNADDRMKIEKDLGRFENEVSHIVKEKILGKDDIYLTIDEDEKLKLFFAIMGFRSKNTGYKLGYGVSNDTRQFYSTFQPDGNISDLWKRNLGYLVNCRSLNEVMEHNEIDLPIKMFMMRDVFGVYGMHFSIVKCSEECEGFIIGDSYPVVVNGEITKTRQLQLYSIHPISPDTVILLVGNGADNAPRDLTVFRASILQLPWLNEEKKTIKFRARTLSKKETEHINGLIERHANEGFAFKKLC